MMSVFKTADGERAVLDRYRDILRQWPVENRQHRVATRLGESFVVESGAEGAPPLVLLHGTASNAASWIVDVPVWSQHFRVFCVDIVGDAGLSAQVRPAYRGEDHATWLGDVMAAFSLTTVSLVGMSLGAWLALDYATRRPERVKKLVLLSPGGIGRNRNILYWAIPLLLLGSWGRGKMLERIGGRRTGPLSPSASAIVDLTTVIFTHFRPRTAPLPQVSDEELRRLTMPVLAILGGRDVFIHAAETKQRLEQNLPHLTMRYEPEGHHFVPGQTAAILEFLLSGTAT
jgi:pimeloyl-ACP methyl ester carboxylesterase